MRLEWLYLLIAGLFEIGWPLGFKLSQTTRFKWPFITLPVLSMAPRFMGKMPMLR